MTMSTPKSVLCCWGTPGRALAMIAVVLACASDAQAVSIDTVTVGNPGNAGDTQIMTIDGTTGYGVVGASYSIGKYEVTAGQYTEFLNAVAKSDPYGLYSENMDSDAFGCQITRNGSDGSYTYDFSGGTSSINPISGETIEAPGSTAADWENRPVNYVNWGDAARFVNWLHNGQPTGAQGLGTTEDGAYDLTAMSSLFNPDGSFVGAPMIDALLAVTRETDGKWAIPTEDEWYKAAYYDPDKAGGAGYWDYATGTDSVPSNALDLGDNNATFGNAPDYFEDLTIGSPFYRTEVGAHENSGSPYGTFDMMGNLLEWNEALIADAGGCGPASPPTCGTVINARGVRGGNFYHFADDGPPSEDRKHFSPIDKRRHLGFRVVKISDSSPLCDFDHNFVCHVADINQMFQVGDLVMGVPTSVTTDKFDLVDNDIIDAADITEWLSLAATKNGYDSPYSRGDIDLDHDVDTADLTRMIINFTGAAGSGRTWSTGDTDADDDVDTGDLTTAIINFTSARNAAAAVPEPSSLLLLVLAVGCLAATRGRSFRNVQQTLQCLTGRHW